MSRVVARKLLLSSAFKQYRNVNSRCFCITSCKQNVNNNILTNPEKIHIPKISVPEYIFSQTEKFADFVAFECPISKRKYTYREIQQYSNNLSKFVKSKFSLSKGDAALIYMQNSPEFPIAALGCVQAGVIASTANALYTSDEILRQLNDSSAKIVITSYELYDNALKAVEKLPKTIPIICVRTKTEQLLPRGSIDFHELIKTNLDVPDVVPPNSNDIAFLPYSSGTTGLPKGVQLSHSNIVSNLAQIEKGTREFVIEAHGNFQEVSPGILPMFHIYGLVLTTLKVMQSGVKILTIPKFHPDTFIDILKDYPISMIFGAPPLILFLTHHPDVKLEYLSNLKHIMSGAAPLGALDEQKFLDKVGDKVFVSQGYGLTETSPVVSVVTREIRKKYGKAANGSIGQIVSNTEAKIINTGDPKGVPLGPNEQGELLVRGPQVMQGYHKNDKATKNTFIDDWFRTGDLAYYDENGLIFITDRVKELIKVRGFQVAPAELEELLRDHPKISDAAVVGIPHEIYGEVPRAYIQTRGEVDVDEIHKFVEGKIAKYKRLEGGIEVVSEIPKNPAGKILRRQLKQKYLDEQTNV